MNVNFTTIALYVITMQMSSNCGDWAQNRHMSNVCLLELYAQCLPAHLIHHSWATLLNENKGTKSKYRHHFNLLLTVKYLDLPGIARYQLCTERGMREH